MEIEEELINQEILGPTVDSNFKKAITRSITNYIIRLTRRKIKIKKITYDQK